MTITASTFAHQVLGSPAWPPPSPAPESEGCWFCAAPCGERAWPLESVLTPTMTNHNIAAIQRSQAVCEACAWVMASQAWKDYVAANPDKGLKAGKTMGFRSYSHAFWQPDHHECPVRARWRELLVSPPEPPFLFVITTSGQKHQIFRSQVAHDRDRYPVQFDDVTVWLDREWFASTVTTVEEAMSIGLGRVEISTLQWRPVLPKAASLSQIGHYRTALTDLHHASPQAYAIACHVAQREKE